MGNEALKIAGFILAPNICGWIGALLTAGATKTWYKRLNKPKLNPPNWIFGPVWTALYSMMGYASYLIYANGSPSSIKLPLTLYGI
jgi:tryptophan-rich sensory protein